MGTPGWAFPFLWGGALGSGRTEASAPTEGYKGCGKTGRRGRQPLRRVTRSAVQRGIPQTRRCRVSFPYAGESLGRGCGCPCCGAQNFCAALRRTLEILTAATRSPRFLCHWQRSVRSPRALCAPAMTAFFHEEGNEKRPAWAGRGIPYAFQLSVRWRHSSS